MFTKLEQLSWIKIEVAWGRSTQECFQELREASGDAALHIAQYGLKRSGKAGMPLRTTSVHDDRVENNTVAIFIYGGIEK